jgi:hypothetical protein
MTVVRDDIMTDVETCLAGKATEIEVMPEGNPSRFPALHIYDDGDGAQQRTETGTHRQAMKLTIEGFIEQEGGREALAELNALYAAAVKAIFEMADASPLIEEAVQGDMRINRPFLGDRRRLAFSADIPLIFPTLRGDPAAI